MGFQIEGESGAAQAERRAGDEQKDCLHGLHEGAAELDGQFSARTVKITKANSTLSDNSASLLQDPEFPPQRFYNLVTLLCNLPFSDLDRNESAEF